MADDKRALPQFRVLKTGEQPPMDEYHILSVHRIRRLELVHEITSLVPAAAEGVHLRIGANALTGSPGEALREADRMAVECDVRIVYVRDDTPAD